MIDIQNHIRNRGALNLFDGQSFKPEADEAELSPQYFAILGKWRAMKCCSNKLMALHSMGSLLHVYCTSCKAGFKVNRHAREI